MWRGWILILCVAGMTSAQADPQSFSVSAPTRNRVRNGRENAIRRFACPVGFFRLRRNCYYLSAGKASWREAYFHCKDRNATLAVPDRKGKDRVLRKYLMGEQFTKLERWIGGIYNWQQMDWVWGVAGNKMEFQNFGKREPGDKGRYAWHCVILNPKLRYKWSPRSCVEQKHYVCEVPAGRIGSEHWRLENEPQNQRLKPRKKGKKYREAGPAPIRRQDGQAQPAWRQDLGHRNENGEWAHGVNLGSRPPLRMRIPPQAKPSDRVRHRSRSRLPPAVPTIARLKPNDREYGAFLGDSPGKTQKLAGTDKGLPHLHFRSNDLSMEEVLLKT